VALETIFFDDGPLLLGAVRIVPNIERRAAGSGDSEQRDGYGDLG
jgi:hypothetical protein